MAKTGSYIHQSAEDNKNTPKNSSNYKMVDALNKMKNKLVANSNSSDCSTTFEDDFSKMSPKKFLY